MSRASPSFRIGLNISTVIASLALLGALIMVGKAGIAEYVSYRVKTDNNTEALHTLRGNVEILKQALPQEINKVDRDLDSIQKIQAIIQTTVESNHTRLMDLENAQITTRAELKELNQNKLGTTAYWRGQTEVTRRLDRLGDLERGRK